MAKIQIVKDGSVQGWFVSFLFSMITILALIASLIFDKVAERFAKVGTVWAAIAITQFTAWLAYRTGKAVEERRSLAANPPTAPPTQ